MSDRSDALVQDLFNKPDLQACSLQQVDYLAHQYPYFRTAQLLLLKKTEAGSDAYARQLQRAALHFSNPLQLQFLLQPEVFETEMTETELFENPILPEEIEQEVAAPEIEIAETPAVIDEEPPATEVPAAAVAVADTLPEATAVAEQPEPEKEQPAETPVFTFEPYHTVDYFASQGIKLSQQEVAGDTLGKQLKSFTDWLKTMKRLPETVAPQPIDPASERKVVNLAVHSLDKADVVTESMAEVWLKQGNKQKAAEVYQKLSLQNPAKSAYFAAKIDSLKQT